MTCLVCAVVILFVALAPVSERPPVGYQDKVNHVLAFFVLAGLARFGWPLRTAGVLVALVAFGGVIEALQLFTPDHHADPLDLVADGIGIAAGWLAHALVRAWVFRRSVAPG